MQNKPLPVDLYVSVPEIEYQVKIDDIMIGWALLQNGSWTAYPLVEDHGIPGFDTEWRAAEWLACNY